MTAASIVADRHSDRLGYLPQRGVNEVELTVDQRYLRAGHAERERIQFTSLLTSFPHVTASARPTAGQMKYFTPQQWLHSSVHSRCGGQR
jgi:hypothetical protein